MKSRLLLCLFAFGLLAGSAQAAQTPRKSQADGRIQYQSYNAGDVTVIKGKNGFTTAIRFDDDEKIKDAYLGFNGWAVEDRGNTLYIKPIAVGDSGQMIEPRLKDWDTNLIVTTSKRHYAFDLILVDEKAKDSAYFVSFSYPEEEARKQALAQQRQQTAQEREEVNRRLNSHAIPRNWDFAMKVGRQSRSIAPSYTYDDGVRTYFGFSSKASVPAVFYYQGDTEMASNTSQRIKGAYTEIIVHKVAERFILRSGEQVVGIINHGFNKNPSPERGTLDDSVERATLDGEGTHE